MTTDTQTEQIEWVAVARAQKGGASYHREWLRSVYVDPDGWAQATDGFRLRRVDYHTAGDEPYLIHIDVPGRELKPKPDYPRDISRLFHGSGIIMLNIRAAKLRDYVAAVIDLLKARGIGRRSDDPDWFDNQQPGPSTGGVISFEAPDGHLKIQGRSSATLHGMRDGEDMAIPEVEAGAMYIDGDLLDSMSERTLDAWYLRDALDGIPDNDPVLLSFMPKKQSPVRIVYRQDRLELIMPLGNRSE